MKILEKYYNHFNDIFPLFAFKGNTENEIKEIINSCIEHNQDVYDMGYLVLDNCLIY